ncbi:MAG: TolC family protein [Acidobacteria bacterium]|nr:TolC family protein [Acidobacteriota bacterium]
MRPIVLLSLTAFTCLRAEVHTLTLRQVVERALLQNPELAMARLDELKASEGVRIARDPFFPKVFVGSGLAYSSGFPMSIDGSAPSIVEARAIQSIYNRSKSLQVAVARESARGAGLSTAAKRDEIAFQTASLYLDAQRAVRNLDSAGRQAKSLEVVAGLVRARVGAGRELEIENRRAALALAQARQRALVLETRLDSLEGSLAVVLGFGSDDRVRATADPPAAVELPASEEAAVEEALAGSKELKRLESALQAKALEAMSARASRYPQVDLVAQYGLFAKFNNYEDFFRRFQRHNGQLGVSFTLPVFSGSAAAAQSSQAQLEVQRLRLQIGSTRDRITLDSRRAYREVRQAEAATEVARLDLDVARDQVSILLAQSQEGRAGLRDLEQARSLEQEKWIAFYDAQHAAARARLELLRQTGTIVAALR